MTLEPVFIGVEVQRNTDGDTPFSNLHAMLHINNVGNIKVDAISISKGIKLDFSVVQGVQRRMVLVVFIALLLLCFT